MLTQVFLPSTARCVSNVLFGITSDGTVITELKKYKSVKTYEKYNDMIHVMSNWGVDAVLKEASSDDPVAAEIWKFRKSNTHG